jgi:hypothetical protein
MPFTRCASDTSITRTKTGPLAHNGDRTLLMAALRIRTTAFFWFNSTFALHTRPTELFALAIAASVAFVIR